MKDALQYLEAVLPPEGLRVVAYKPKSWTTGGFKHLFCEDNAAVIATVESLEANHTQSWIALATYADPEQGRKGTNTVDIQSLFLDVDYKEYDSPEEAEDDLQRFVDFLGEPSIRVLSGGGSHNYWVLRAPMSTHDWLPLATAFKAAWQNMGVKGDPSVSADMARVLRLPGTVNRKEAYGENGRVVEMVSFTELTYDAGALAKKLGAVAAKPAPKLPIGFSVPAALYDSNDDLGGGMERRPSFVGPMVKQCRQLQHIFRHQDQVSEPVWFAAIQVARHLEDGRRVAHIFSNKHPDYSPERTDAKLSHLERNSIGPTKCDKFRSINPSGCEGCTFNITSPIQLGYKEIENVQPTIVVTEHVVTESGEVAVVERIEQPNITIPFGYKYDGHSIYMMVKNEQTEMQKEEVIFEGFLCPERLVTDSGNNHSTEVQLYVHSKGQPPKHVTVPGKSISDKKDLARELTGKGVFFMPNKANAILNMVAMMVQEVQATKRDAILAAQMGWQPDDTFVVGATGYHANEAPVYDLPVPASTKSVVKSYEPRGSLDEWKRTANVYNAKGAEPYQFALLYGAAGVFLRMAKLSGVVLSLCSQLPGRGKTTAGLAALSWWGNPEKLKSQSKDTNNALFGKASRHKNLPILMDEITDKAPAELEELVYFMSQGREKESMTADRVSRVVLPSWELPVISTSNNSIRSKLKARRGDAQGLFARIIEIPMDLPFVGTVGYQDRQQLRHGFIENYGQAGPMMVKFFLENRDFCKQVMDKFAKSFDAAVASDPAYRFWVASASATMMALVAARRLGLVDYDLNNLSAWTSKLLRSQMAEASQSMSVADDILAQFLEVNANRIIVTYMRKHSGVDVEMIYPEEGVHGSQLVGRAELAPRSLYVSASAFSRFCHESGYDMSAFIRNAVEQSNGEPLLKSPGTVSINLGRGTKTAAARIKSLEFNLMHPSLVEFATGIDSQIVESSHLKVVK